MGPAAEHQQGFMQPAHAAPGACMEKAFRSLLLVLQHAALMAKMAIGHVGVFRFVFLIFLAHRVHAVDFGMAVGQALRAQGWLRRDPRWREGGLQWVKLYVSAVAHAEGITPPEAGIRRSGTAEYHSGPTGVHRSAA